MSSVLHEPSEAPTPLTEQLIGAAQALAAAQTQAEVLAAVLRPALFALNAVAGAVLLVDEEGQTLQMAEHHGYGRGPEDRTIWQDGPLGAQVPAADVLRLGHALYFEDSGSLQAAYPELEARTGAVAAVASAVLPMLLGAQPLGTLVLDFAEPHVFSPEEKYFLRTLAAQSTIALSRAGHLDLLGQRLEARGRRIQEDARAQEAFVAFTEAVGSETDLPALIRQAIAVLQGRFPGASIGYFDEEERVWSARVWSREVTPELAGVITAGLLAETPTIAHLRQTRRPVFTEGWNARPDGTEEPEGFGAIAAYPLTLNGGLHGLLAVALRDTREWSEADQRLVRAVGRGLNLALERTRTARELTLRNAELQARTRALEAFADLTRDLALTTDPLLLIRRAQEVVMSMLADGSALYYVPGGDRWFCRSQHGTLHSSELQAAVDAGLPFADTRNLLIPWTSGQPYFQAHYDQTTDQLSPNVGHVGATATLPLRVGGVVSGVMAFVLFQQRSWSSVDRVLLETAVQSLELALDRAAQARKLDEERAALEAFARFTEEVGSETDVQALVRQAITLLADTCEVDAAYFERDGELFRITAWSLLADPHLLALFQQGFALKDSGIARLLLQNTAAFVDHWNDTGLLIPESGVYRAVAGYPYFVAGGLRSVLMVGSTTAVIWDERTRGIFRAVGRSLDLALERARQTRELEEERAALEAFTRFTEQVGSETDVQALVGQAIALLVDTCGVDAVYLERSGDRYTATAWNTLFDRGFLATLQLGFPLRQSSLALMLRSNAAAFIDHWNDHQEAAGMLIEESLHLQAVAGYPLFQDGEMQSVLLMASRTSPIWAEQVKRIFRAVGRSLDLALDRARQTRTVTDQRDALDARTQELAASTEELNAFSYSVSHDLRTPVRHMLGFLQLARTALDGRLDDRSARYLDVVEQAGGQMNTLIDALLNLSNAAQQSLRPTVVDLNELMAQLQTTLLPDLLTRNVQWEVAPLPSVYGDRDALKQVLTQLTENALKFTRTRDPAIIRVWAEDQGESWRITVGDNGLGFDPRYQDRLFTLFQRLHSAQEATGTGVGLASVRRLIQKHGGGVFAEGQVGQGATFGFTLPNSAPPPRKG